MGMLEIGQKSSVKKTFTKEEVLLFSQNSMDSNPIHFDSEYATTTRMGQIIVQGPFVVSLIGGILGSALPGPGTIYINQNTSFLKPVFIGEEVTANVEVISVRTDKPVIKLRTWVEKNGGEIVIDGEAVIYYLGEFQK